MTGHCSKCHKIWTLDTQSGVCQWCGKPTTCQSPTAKPRSIKSRSNGRKRQANGNGNGYDQLAGNWLSFYNVASRFSHKAKVEDTEDLLHDIIVTLAVAERNNGHKPFSQAAMYRIASRAVADYWFKYYEINNGLDCRHCSKAQRAKCKEDDLYTECPKAIKLESLNKPILDSEGNITELGELIADDKAIDLVAMVDAKNTLNGYPSKAVQIAYKRYVGYPLDKRERAYLSRFSRRAQKTLI
jgi:hypothetical protein